MRNRLSALHFQDKIFIAYGFVFLVMFGAVFGSTRFLIHLAFKREIDDYVETRQARISNNYQAFLNQVQKDVHAAAADERLHRAIEMEQSYEQSYLYQPTSEFDLFEYGTPDGKLLYPGPQLRRNAPVYRSLDNREAHIEFRRIPQRSDLGQQFVVQGTAAGEWGFVTGGYNLQTWLEEKETIIQSDEHPVFLVRKPPIPEPTVFDAESSEMTAEDWLPLNNAARGVPFDGWLQSFSGTQPTTKGRYTWIRRDRWEPFYGFPDKSVPLSFRTDPRGSTGRTDCRLFTRAPDPVAAAADTHTPFKWGRRIGVGLPH